MDMLGIIPRSGVLKSQFRNSSGLKKKKKAALISKWNSSGGGEESGFVLSESPPRGEVGGAHWVMGTGSWPSSLPSLHPPGQTPLQPQAFRGNGKDQKTWVPGTGSIFYWLNDSGKSLRCSEASVSPPVK